MLKNIVVIACVLIVNSSYSAHKGNMEELQNLRRRNRHQARLEESRKRYDYLTARILERQRKEDSEKFQNRCACLLGCCVGVGSVAFYLKKEQ